MTAHSIAFVVVNINNYRRPAAKLSDRNRTGQLRQTAKTTAVTRTEARSGGSGCAVCIDLKTRRSVSLEGELPARASVLFAGCSRSPRKPTSSPVFLTVLPSPSGLSARCKQTDWRVNYAAMTTTVALMPLRKVSCFVHGFISLP